MNEITKEKLEEAQQYCDDNDKSTEFMLEYMQDYADVNLDCVIKFLTSDGGFEDAQSYFYKKDR